MAVCWRSLPAEVLRIVFEQRHDLRQPASFRLVCEAWNPVAERPMFRQKLILHKSNMIQFCNHLLRKPRLGRLRYMDFEPVSIVKNQHWKVIERIIKLAFTPNIVIVKGNIPNACYNQMLEAVVKSTRKYSNIKYRSWPQSFNSIHAKLMYKFRQTLKSLDLTVSSRQQPNAFILDRLTAFSYLSTLTLHFQQTASLLLLEHILGKCFHLAKLELDLSYYFEKSLGNANETATRMTEKCGEMS